MFVSLAQLEKEYRELEAAGAAWLARLAEYDRAGDYALDNYPSTAVAVRTVCRMNPGVANGHVDLARKLGDLPRVAEAFSRGDISRAHATVVADDGHTCRKRSTGWVRSTRGSIRTTPTTSNVPSTPRWNAIGRPATPAPRPNAAPTRS